MQRRTFLTTACACGLSAVAGCLSTGTAPESDSNRHPFAEATLSVRIDNTSETDHDVDQIGHDSLAFWEEHSREYVDFGVEFEVVSSDDPDIVIAFADDPSGCEGVEGYSERVLGCAPLIHPGSQARRPATARVVAGHRPVGKIRVTTKHELGHIFGLGHDDEPRWIMSNQPADRIPLYQHRIDIWEQVLTAQERGGDGTRLFNDSVTAWQDGRYGQAEASASDAHEAYSEMRELLGEAQEWTHEFDGHERVETVNLSRLRSLLSLLYRRASAAEWFSWYLAVAARHVQDGADDAAQDALEEVNGWIREYNGIETVEVRDVAIALGLVRGFDRDDPVLEDEEEGVAADS